MTLEERRVLGGWKLDRMEETVEAQETTVMYIGLRKGPLEGIAYYTASSSDMFKSCRKYLLLRRSHGSLCYTVETKYRHQ